MVKKINIVVIVKFNFNVCGFEIYLLNKVLVIYEIV